MGSTKVEATENPALNKADVSDCCLMAILSIRQQMIMDSECLMMAQTSFMMKKPSNTFLRG